MQRLLPLVMLVIAVSLTAQPLRAQFGIWTHQIGFDAGPQIPMALPSSEIQRSLGASSWNEATAIQVGWGLSFNYYYRVSPYLFVSASASINRFTFGKATWRDTGGRLVEKDLSQHSWINIPVLAGLRYNFALTGIQPYIGIEVGAHFNNNYSDGFSASVATLLPVNLGVTPKAGIRYKIQSGLDADFSAKFNYLVSSDIPFSYFSINVGLSYALSYSE